MSVLNVVRGVGPFGLVQFKIIVKSNTKTSAGKRAQRHKPWLHPVPFPPTSRHLWCGSCSAHMCSQRSIVFSEVSVSPLTNSRSPRMRLWAPLPLRSYLESAAQSWGRETQWNASGHAENTRHSIFHTVFDWWWNPVPQCGFQFSQSSWRFGGWTLMNIREIISHLSQNSIN